MVPWTAVLTAGVQEMSNSARKWLETAIRASLGQRWNQFMVQPEISPGNFSDLLRNFSPTCRQREITCIKFNIFSKSSHFFQLNESKYVTEISNYKKLFFLSKTIQNILLTK